MLDELCRMNRSRIRDAGRAHLAHAWRTSQWDDFWTALLGAESP
jgi:hypothetical protein